MELKVINEIPNNINKTITLFGDSHTLCFVGLSIRANKYLLQLFSKKYSFFK